MMKKEWTKGKSDDYVKWIPNIIYFGLINGYFLFQFPSVDPVAIKFQNENINAS